MSLMRKNRILFILNSIALSMVVQSVDGFGATFISCGREQKIIQQVLVAVRKTKTQPILDLIDKQTGLAWGGDAVRSYSDAKKDLESKSGPLYCRLFGCTTSKSHSVRSQLEKIDDKKLKIKCSTTMLSDDKKTKWLRVIFSWPGKSDTDELGSITLKQVGEQVFIEELFTD